MGRRVTRLYVTNICCIIFPVKNKQQNQPVRRHALPLLAGALLIVSSVALSNIKFSDRLSASIQQDALKEIVQKTQSEYAYIRDQIAAEVSRELEAELMHASAEEKAEILRKSQGVVRPWYSVVIDEVARWFGLGK